MKDPQRALRRHHIQRLKAVRRFYWGANRDLRLEPRRLGKAVQTAHPCSCWMCGNPRAYSGRVSIQERRYPTVAEEANLMD